MDWKQEYTLPLTGRQKVSGIHEGRSSTPSVSPPVLGETTDFLLGSFSNRCGAVSVALPKIEEGSGGVDVEEALSAEPSRLGRIRLGLRRKESFCQPLLLFTFLAWSSILLLTAGCATFMDVGGEETTWYGGQKTTQRLGIGYFQTAKIDGQWWLIDPEGGLFFSKGVNHVSYSADHAPDLGYSPYKRCVERKYGSEEAWAEAAVQRLQSWGFNTLGAWSAASTYHQGMAYTPTLDLGRQAGGDWLRGTFPDVFSQAFQEGCLRVARRECAPRATDPYLLGYFTDNELSWGPDWRQKESLLIRFLRSDSDTAGHDRAIRFLEKKYGTPNALGRAWKAEIETFEQAGQVRLPHNDIQRQDEDEFQYLVARRYFRVCHDSIREFDPNHLIIGCRFAGRAPEPVLRAMKDYVHVVSYNRYDHTPPKENLERIHKITGLPIMLTEFSFKAMDSGLPNTRGAGTPVQTQQDRADLFEAYVTALARMPFMVGYHWFEHADEPAEGRFDGENSNYGLVNINDEPWRLLVDRMTQVNQRLLFIHKNPDTAR